MANRPGDPVYLVIRNSVMFSFLMLFAIIASAIWLDQPAAQWALGLSGGLTTDFLESLAFWINPYTVAIIVVFLIAHHWFTYEMQPGLFLSDPVFIRRAAVLVTLLFTLLMKVSLGRARPELLTGDAVSGFFGLQTERAFHSMPSGHAAGVTAGVLLLYSELKNQYVTAIAVILGLLILTGRVILAEHFVSDVLAGFWIAVLVWYWAELYIKSTRYPEVLI